MNKRNVIKLPSPCSTADAVILADGDYPASPIASGILHGAGKVICCDGAAAKFVANGGEPYAIVGDCDSLDAELLQRFSGIIHRDPDQETNDLTKAVNFCFLNGFRRLIILGATGKREDHTIGNISLLADYADILDEVYIVTERGVFHAIDCDTFFESVPGGQMSVITFSPETLITTVNLVYPLHRASLTRWWQGTLNQSPGEVFGIRTTGKTIVFRLFGK